MAFLDEEFDVLTLPVSEMNFDPLPTGWYSVSIKGAELKNTKDGTGNYIAVRYDVSGPTHAGRVVWGNINIRNKSEKASEIGRQHLGELMRAIGLAKVSDTDQLIGGNLQIKLSIREDEKYGSSNEVKAFKALDGEKPPIAMAATAKPATTKAKPAWAK